MSISSHERVCGIQAKICARAILSPVAMSSRAQRCALVAPTLLACGLACGLTCGCAETPRSCELDTSALVMLATVSDNDAGVEVEIEFETATGSSEEIGTALALCPSSDTLSVNGVEADEQLTLGHLYYIAQFEPGTPSFEIVLERKDKTNVTATVEMPPAFELTAPTPASEHSRTSNLAISWAPAWDGQEIDVLVGDEIGSTCIEGLGYIGSVDDSGSFVLPAGSLTNGSTGGSCEARVALTRVLEAPYPGVLAPGGSLTAVVNRRVSIESTD